jgi:GNAT superfamily N-acetyltransferase
MSQSVEISIAKEEDIPALCTLLELLFSQELEFSPNREAQRQGLHSIIHNPHVGFILVGKVNGRAAGMVNILFTISTALGERVAILEDMVVSTSSRSSGIGAALIEQAIAEARNRGCKRITLLADASNEAAHRFYQRHGFVKSTMIPLRLSLMSE